MTVKRKDVVVTVRFTANEAEALRQAAATAEESVSAYVRDSTIKRLISGGRASVASTTGTVMYSGTTTGTGFSGQTIGGEGQPVGGNLAAVRG